MASPGAPRLLLEHEAHLHVEGLTFDQELVGQGLVVVLEVGALERGRQRGQVVMLILQGVVQLVQHRPVDLAGRHLGLEHEERPLLGVVVGQRLRGHGVHEALAQVVALGHEAQRLQEPGVLLGALGRVLLVERGLQEGAEVLVGLVAHGHVALELDAAQLLQLLLQPRDALADAGHLRGLALVLGDRGRGDEEDGQGAGQRGEAGGALHGGAS